MFCTWETPGLANPGEMAHLVFDIIVNYVAFSKWL